MKNHFSLLLDFFNLLDALIALVVEFRKFSRLQDCVHLPDLPFASTADSP
jgi:hypothetical protein